MHLILSKPPIVHKASTFPQFYTFLELSFVQTQLPNLRVRPPDFNHVIIRGRYQHFGVFRVESDRIYHVYVGKLS